MKTGTGTGSSQRGIVIPLVAIAMLALLGMTGLALDMGHLYENKTRLQNAVDAAALAAAKKLDETKGDQAAATLAAQNTVVAYNGQNSANKEMSALTNADVIVQFSPDYWGLAPGACNVSGVATCFVRVRVNNLPRPNFLVQVLGLGPTKTVAARAVAGPVPVNPCDVFPVTACAKPPAPGGAVDTDDAADDGLYYGYKVDGTAACLKSPNVGGQPSPECAALGPGNFHLLDLADSQGGSDLCQNLAGLHERCLGAPGATTVDLKQGYTNGPVQDGINTRFNEYPNGQNCGGLTRQNAPPDKVVSYGPGSPGATHASWLGATDEIADGVKGRRIVAVPISNCPPGCSGNACKPPLLGVGCFFLRNKMDSGKPGELIGEFTGDACLSNGNLIQNPGTGPSTYEIVLYKDPGSLDS